MFADTDSSYVSDNISLDEGQNHTATSYAGETLVRNLSLAEFRQRLIIHFDIAYRCREISGQRYQKIS